MVQTPRPVDDPATDTTAQWVTNPRWENDAEIAHGLTTRHFAAPETPPEERLAAIREELGMPGATSVILDQVHGVTARWLDPAAGAKGQVLCLDKTDAVITDRRGVLLHLAVADCVPILAVERGRGIIGAAHAGWRGTVKGVAANLIREMAEHGADLDNAEVWLGPSISQKNFQVGPDVLEQFTAVNDWWPAIDLSGRRVDLALVNRLQMARAGVPPDRMVTSSLCTVRDRQLLHSHRAEPDCPGRMMAVISLRDSS